MQRNDTQQLDAIDDNLMLCHDDVANNIKNSYLLPKLPIADICHLGQLSTKWYGFMSNNAIWQWLIARDFGIPIDVTARFIQIAKYFDPNVQISFAEIYRRLYCLSKQIKPEMRSLIEFCRQPDHVFCLLTCCLNNEPNQTLLQAMIPRDEAKWWIQFSVIASANRTTKTLLQSFGFDFRTIYNLNRLANQLGNLELTRHLISLDTDDIDGHCLDVGNYFSVGNSGNIELLEYMLSVDAYGFDPSVTLSKACENGHYTMAIYLIEKYQITLVNGHLENAIESGNLHLVRYLIETHRLMPTIESLRIAASFGHLEVLRWLISISSLRPNGITFQLACTSGNEELVYFLIQEYGFIPHKNNLDSVAESGNYKLFTRFIHEYPLVPNESTLLAVISSGSFELLQLLIDEFRLIPDHLHLMPFTPRWNMMRHVIDAYQLEVDEEIRNYIIDWLQCIDDMVPEISLIIKARLPFIHIDPLRKDPAGHEYRDYGMKAYQALKMAVLHLRNAEIEAAMTQWQQAAKFSARLFFTFAVMAVGNPKQFNLDKDHVSRLIEVMGDAVSIPHALIEREAIYQLLSTATDERLKVLASAFTPPPIQPIFCESHQRITGN